MLALELALQGFLVGPTTLPSPWVDPGPWKLAWIQSPNCDRRPDLALVDTIVVHATVNSTLESTTRWFYTTDSKVSAHFTIGKDGSVVQHVSTFDRAWHAGVSEDAQGRTGLNAYSIGIELVNLNDGRDPYPQVQLDVLKAVIRVMARRFPIRTIVSHEFIARPFGRKSDPRNFPWGQLGELGLQLGYTPEAASKAADKS